VPINPETIEIKKDQAFNVMINPPGIDKDDYFTEDREKTIEWHAKNYKVERDDIVAKWKEGVAQRTAWKNFCSYCDKYVVEKRRGQWYPEPIPAGYNIAGFDIPIAKRMAKKHKTKLPFSSATRVDMYDNIFWWFENLEEPEDFKMDTLRKFFGLPQKGTAHDALQDVYDEAEIIVRFMKFHRRQARVDKFKGAFAR
jgi:hypothetical protein